MPALQLSPLLWIVGPLAFGACVFALLHGRRVMVEHLARLAGRRGGRLFSEPWYTTPRIEWTLGGVRLTVSVRGEPEESRRSGQRTFAHTTGAYHPSFDLELMRAESADDDARSLGTRSIDFERAFRAVTNDPARARELVDGDLRHALLAFDPELDLCVHLGEASVFRDGMWQHHQRERRLEVSIHGMPEDGEVLEALLRLSRGLHEHLERHAARRAA